MSRGRPFDQVSWCFPEEYDDCNNNYHGMCCVRVGNCSFGDKCPFYRSVKDTPKEDLKRFHSWDRKAGNNGVS